MEVTFTQTDYLVDERDGFVSICINATGGQIDPSTVFVSTADFSAEGMLWGLRKVQDIRLIVLD